MATTLPRACRARTTRTFWEGLTLREDRDVIDPLRQRLARGVELGPGEHLAAAVHQLELRGDRLRRRGWSPVIMTTRTPASPSPRTASAAEGRTGSAIARSPSSSRRSMRPVVQVGPATRGTLGDRQHPVALARQAVGLGTDLGATGLVEVLHRSVPVAAPAARQHCLRGALHRQSRPARPRARAPRGSCAPARRAAGPPTATRPTPHAGSPAPRGRPRSPPGRWGGPPGRRTSPAEWHAARPRGCGGPGRRAGAGPAAWRRPTPGAR